MHYKTTVELYSINKQYREKCFTLAGPTMRGRHPVCNKPEQEEWLHYYMVLTETQCTT